MKPQNKILFQIWIEQIGRVNFFYYYSAYRTSYLPIDQPVE